MEAAPERDHVPTRYPFELGATLAYSLDAPCAMYVYDLRCEETNGSLDVHPFATSSRYRLSCANGHYVRDVPRSEVELRFGVATPGTRGDSPLAPNRRIALNVLLRDESTCVYCGRRAGDSDFDGPVVVAARQIVPPEAIDPQDVRYDAELRTFARDVQVVTACRSRRCASRDLPGLDDARETFIRSVLRENVTGSNLTALRIFERLYRLAERRRPSN